MSSYNFGTHDIYVGKGGKFNIRGSKDIKRISKEEKEKIANLFSKHLLKIHYTDISSYDDSDDDCAGTYYSSSNTYVYREVDVEGGVEGLVMHDDEITGVVFYLKDGDDVYANVFYFSDEPKNTMQTGYSASHSSNYIKIFKVELVKKGENGTPERAQSVSFRRHCRDTSI